jgi:hypothetical protein
MMADAKGAILSGDGLHRYKLWRIWDFDRPAALFVMLNPSTADAEKDDNTIRKCITMVKDWGHHGGFYVGNLFSHCTSAPSELKNMDLRDQKALQRNDAALVEMRALCSTTIVAWGNNGLDHEWRASCVLRSLQGPLALRITKRGGPHHPSWMIKLPKWEELSPYGRPLRAS